MPKLSKLHAARFGSFQAWLAGFLALVDGLSPEVKAAAKVLFDEVVHALLASTLKASPKKFTAFEQQAGKLGVNWAKLLELAQLIAGLIKDRAAKPTS